MYELIDKINDYEIRDILTAFYNDLMYTKMFKDVIDFKNTPFECYDCDEAIKDFEKVVKFIIKNQKN